MQPIREGSGRARRPPTKAIVTTAERPDLIDVAAEWIWAAFWKESGYSFDDICALVAASNAVVGPAQCFVLLVDGEPVGTASLIVNDLSSRPELTPWLAPLYVRTDARGHGYALDLIRAVEAAASVAGFDSIWLYTSTAEGLYLNAGWEPVERCERKGQPAVLMRRDLGSATQK